MREICVSSIYEYIGRIATEQKTKITNIWMYLDLSERKDKLVTTLNIRVATRGFRDEDSTFEDAAELIRAMVEDHFNINVGIVELVHSTIKEDLAATSIDQWFLLSKQYEYEKKNRFGKRSKVIDVSMQSDEKIHIWEKPGDARSYIDGYKRDNRVADLMRELMAMVSARYEFE